MFCCSMQKENGKIRNEIREKKSLLSVVSHISPPPTLFPAQESHSAKHLLPTIERDRITLNLCPCLRPSPFQSEMKTSTDKGAANYMDAYFFPVNYDTRKEEVF